MHACHFYRMHCTVVSGEQKLKLASLAQTICTLYTFSSLVHSLLPKDNNFKYIFASAYFDQIWQVSRSVFLVSTLSSLHHLSLVQGIFEPVHEIYNNVVCATSKASDQPAHTRSPIRALASHLSIL